jgi:Lon protease-like protein
MTTRHLPLFPLKAVFFPRGRITLQVFEARYLDLMSRCLREGTDFGIVHITQGNEVRGTGDDETRFAAVGVTVRVDQADMPRNGLMLVSLVAQRRFRMGAVDCVGNGLWTTQAVDMLEDPAVAPAPERAALVEMLRKLMARFDGRGMPFAGEPRFDDAGWVANRWGQMLPIEAHERQALLEIDDPHERLARVAGWLAR